MENCIFCKIAAGAIPAKVVYQNEDVLAFEDISPVAPEHILIIPKRHLASMNDLTAEDGALLLSLHLAAEQIASERGFAESGYRFLTNVGKDGGQSVAHLHYHLLAKRSLQWPPG